MPSHSTKQAKVMAAISHGWKPTGKVADIPVKVAKEFHAADAGHKYGAKAPKVGKGESKGAVDRSSHQKGNPGFPNVSEIATTTLPNRTSAANASGRFGSGHSFGHGATCRSGPLRLSGHSGAHRIGKR